jgi:hypothetical protein
MFVDHAGETIDIIAPATAGGYGNRGPPRDGRL